MSAKVPEQPIATDVRFVDQRMVVDLEDGRELSVPLAWFASIAHANPEQRSNWRLIGGGVGVHWPDLDEDISVAALLARPQTAARVAPHAQEESSPSPRERLGDDHFTLNGGAEAEPEPWH